MNKQCITSHITVQNHTVNDALPASVQRAIKQVSSKKIRSSQLTGILKSVRYISTSNTILQSLSYCVRYCQKTCTYTGFRSPVAYVRTGLSVGAIFLYF